jgi:acetolactate decarboxylase
MKKGIVVAVLGLIVVIVLMMGLRISQNEKAAITTLGPSQSAYQGQERDILYQVSTFNALLDGLYDGQFSFGELRKYGDTGIGTVAGLDGELVVLDGQFYQVKADGVAYPVDDNMQTPFASVSYFDADKTVTLSGSMDFAQLQAKLNEMITNKNIFHVIKINGDFKYVKTRSVPGQQKPYPPMVEVTKNQPEFEFENVTGTLVGFWCPSYVQGINVAGYHMHFLTSDKKAGGHLLDFNLQNGELQLDETANFHLALPVSDDFNRIDLSLDRSQEAEKVEK